MQQVFGEDFQNTQIRLSASERASVPKPNPSCLCAHPAVCPTAPLGHRPDTTSTRLCLIQPRAPDSVPTSGSEPAALNRRAPDGSALPIHTPSHAERAPNVVAFPSRFLSVCSFPISLPPHQCTSECPRTPLGAQFSPCDSPAPQDHPTGGCPSRCRRPGSGGWLGTFRRVLTGHSDILVSGWLCGREQQLSSVLVFWKERIPSRHRARAGTRWPAIC